MLKLSAMVFLQMLPATLLVPAIRPLFAWLHDGNEGAMHLFMSINMLGAIILTPIIVKIADFRRRPKGLLAGLLGLDALLLAVVAGAYPTPVVLFLRLLEGALHVAATTVLLASAAELGRISGRKEAVGIAGMGLMAAIAAGSAIGGMLVHMDPRLPFWAGSAVLLFLAMLVLLDDRCAITLAGVEDRGKGFMWLLKNERELVLPMSAAFIERFCVGCIVVTFSLFAHRVHGLSDGRIGMLYAVFMSVFTILMYPLARTSRVSANRMLSVGGLLYASGLVMIATVPGGYLAPAMLLLGVSGSLVFSATLKLAGAGAPEHRSKAFALVNVSGCLGMLSGPIVAGILSSVFRDPADPALGYRIVFLIAASCVLSWLSLVQRRKSYRLILQEAR
jgi:MFS family permease